MKRILVTSIGGQVGHGILKCLNGYDGQLYGTDIGEYPAGIDGVDVFFKVPFATDEQYIPILLNLCENNCISHLIPANEQEILAVAQNVDLFRTNGITVLALTAEQLEKCSDKYTLPKTLTSLGLDAPLSYTVDEFSPNGEEYIAKLRNSYGSRLVRKFTTSEELLTITAQTTKELVIQQYIPSPETEYTIGVFSTENEIRSITFKRELEGGWSQVVELVDNTEFQPIAERVAHGLGICGCFNIQLRKHENRYYIFEINPRISGTNFFRHQLGFQDVRWWLTYVSGEKLLPYKPKFAKAIGIREFSWQNGFSLCEFSYHSMISFHCICGVNQMSYLLRIVEKCCKLRPICIPRL